MVASFSRKTKRSSVSIYGAWKISLVHLQIASTKIFGHSFGAWRTTCRCFDWSFLDCDLRRSQLLKPTLSSSQTCRQPMAFIVFNRITRIQSFNNLQVTKNKQKYNKKANLKLFFKKLWLWWYFKSFWSKYNVLIQTLIFIFILRWKNMVL